jgi:phosphoenolpyruvate synthase/pyruvate phosphate dikinase
MEGGQAQALAYVEVAMRIGESVDPSVVGGKAANLGKLKNAGFNVPLGVIHLPTDTFTELKEQLEFAYPWPKLNKKPGVAVRSSARGEDSSSHSFAGIYESYLRVYGGSLLRNTEPILELVEICMDSGNTARADAYRERFDLPKETPAVIIQDMVDAEIAGIIFTKHPVDGEGMLIEAVYGLGEKLVQGGNPDATLSESQEAELKATARLIETLFGSPQDIEWAFDKDGVLWILQSRPITTI